MLISLRIRRHSQWPALVVALALALPVLAHPLIEIRGTYTRDASSIHLQVEADQHLLSHFGVSGDRDWLKRFARWLQTAISIHDRRGDRLAGSASANIEAMSVDLSFHADDQIAWPASIRLSPSMGSFFLRGQLVLVPQNPADQASQGICVLTTSGNAVRLNAPSVGEHSVPEMTSSASDSAWPELNLWIDRDAAEIELRVPIPLLVRSSGVGIVDPNRLLIQEQQILERKLIEWSRTGFTVAINRRQQRNINWQARIFIYDTGEKAVCSGATTATLNRWLAQAGLRTMLEAPELNRCAVRFHDNFHCGSIRTRVHFRDVQCDGLLTDESPIMRITFDETATHVSIGRSAWQINGHVARLVHDVADN